MSDAVLLRERGEIETTLSCGVGSAGEQSLSARSIEILRELERRRGLAQELHARVRADADALDALVVAGIEAALAQQDYAQLEHVAKAPELRVTPLYRARLDRVNRAVAAYEAARTALLEGAS